MASADIKAELECSLCLNLYTDPVNLACGHNFCRVCIDQVLDTKEGCGGYSCPECRSEFQDRPRLYRNLTLCNIVEKFLSAHPEEKPEVFCTYCVDSPVPAVRSCLLCEASLCEKHLGVHSKSPEHVLSDPTTSLENRKCSIHKKILEYYCSVDGACICVSCRMDTSHHGHQVDILAAASEIKKNKLKTVQQQLKTMQKETDIRIHKLQKHKKKVLEKADGMKTKLTVLIGDIRRQLQELEERVLSEISGQAEGVSRSVNALIRQMEIKKDDMSRKMRHIEELCDMVDPLTFLQESDTSDLCDTNDVDDVDRERFDKLLLDGGDLDVAGISHTLHTGLSDIITVAIEEIEKSDDILLDASTAGSKLQISYDRKTVTALPTPDKNLPQTPKRFQFSQVMSSQSYSSGRHYWDVEVEGSGSWNVGMCSSSVDRKWNSELCYKNNYSDRSEYNNKYWCINMHNGQYYVLDDKARTSSLGQHCRSRIRIYLDYEAGQISFYELHALVRHIHTFTTTFTEPLHVVLGVWDVYGYLKICRGVLNYLPTTHP